jgi:hypothetical protein
LPVSNYNEKPLLSQQGCAYILFRSLLKRAGIFVPAGGGISSKEEKGIEWTERKGFKSIQGNTFT